MKNNTNIQSYGTDYDKQAEGHAKMAAGIWIAYGVYALFAQKVQGGIGSFVIIFTLYTTVGFFVAALSSMVTFLPKYLISYILFKLFKNVDWLPSVAVFSVVSLLIFILTVIWIVIVAEWFIRMGNSLFGM